MKKVLLYVSEMTYSGSPNSTLRLARALVKLGCYVETWSYSDGPFKVEYEKYQIPVRIVTADELRDYKIIHYIKKFDLFIANSIFTSKAYEGISTLIPSYWYIREAHNIPEFFRNDNKCGHILKNGNNIIAVSEYAAEYIKKYFNTDVRVLHNCVDDMYNPEKEKIKNDKIKIIMIGTIERRKNFVLLIDSFLSLDSDIREKYELHLVGRIFEAEKEYGNYIISKSEDNEDIIYHGEIQDREYLMNLISEMDILAVLSNDESCSLTALEGAMMAKPLLLSENIGAKYLVDEKCGWIVKTDDSGSIQNILKKIIMEQTDLCAMGRIARAHYEETSTFDIYCQNVKSLLDSKFYIKTVYRLAQIKKNKIWYYDDTTKYFSYPSWGSEEEKDRIYSFDIFDTLITRDVATPIGIFSLMQKRMYEDIRFSGISQYVKEQFVELRVGAEGFARQVYCINGIEDKTFDQIYDVMFTCGRLTREDINLIKTLELETELLHTVGISENIEKIEQLVKENKRVILISDMYLSSEFIRKMLVSVNSVFENVPIYVSSECKMMKGTTNLFKYVQRHEKVSFCNWVHVGDNVNADINAPTKLGIECKEFNGTELSQNEKEILGSREKDYYIQQIIGFTKVATAQGLLKTNSVVNDIHNIIQPFIDHAVNYCNEKGYSTVFCANEFGQIVIDLFSNLFELNNIRVIDVTYILGKDYKETVNKLIYLISNKIVTLKYICYIFSISDVEIENYRRELSADLIDIDDANLAVQFLHCDWFHEKYITKQKELKKVNNILFIDYADNGIYKNILNKVLHSSKIEYMYFAKIRKEEKYTDLYYLDIDKKQYYICLKCLKESLKEIYSLDTSLKKLISVTNPYIKTYNRTSIYQYEKNYIDKMNNKYKIDDTWEKYEVLSFGLRDCILTLLTANKSGIYVQMQRILGDSKNVKQFPAFLINSFKEIRSDAENFVIEEYRNKRLVSKDLTEVYKIIQTKYNVSKEGISYLIKLELELIKQNTIGVQENIYKIYDAINKFKKVVLIGDTVYYKNFLKSILIKIDPIFANVELFVTSSAEQYYSNSKVYFQNIINSVGIKKEKWFHIGNSVQFDINGSKALSIRKEQFKKGELLPYEKAALYEYNDNYSAQIMIGTAKNNRLLYKNKKAHVIGNSLAGPMLYPYVEWVLNDTVNRKIKKLLFIARDGYVLKQIADIIIRNKHLNIQTEYVYGSRRAWRMPSYTADEGLEPFFKMAHVNQLKDIQQLSQIFGISYDELEEYLPEKYKSPSYVLETKDYTIIRKFLEYNNEFKLFLEGKARIERVKVAKYFQSICGEEEFSFVELSGTGATQNCLGKILEDITDRRIITYFLNLDGAQSRENIILLNYIPNRFFESYVIENLCRAPHGQTNGYVLDNESKRVVPVLANSDETAALIKHGYLDYVYGVMEFTQIFSSNQSLRKEDIENPVLFQKYLKHITYNPCQDVLDFIGDMPFETTGFGTKLTVFAPKLTQKQMEDIYLTRKSDESIDKYYEGACLDFSLRRMSDEDKKQIEFYKNSVGSKVGRDARIRKRINETGLLKTVDFIRKRCLRSILIKLHFIKY